MSTPPPSPKVESSPDPLMKNQVTVIEVGLAAKYLYFKERLGTSEMYLLRASLGELFVIEFAKYDLRNNRKTGEVVRYRAQGYTAQGKRPEIQQLTNEIRLVYNGVPAESGGSDTIDVTVFIQKEADPRSAEWVRLDISHTYPKGFKNADPNYGYAWEENLIFPNLLFDPMTAQDAAVAKQKVNFTAAEAPFYESVLPPCQFGAFYVPTGTFDATNFAQGIALHVEDEHGHEKAFTHNTIGDPVTSHLFSLNVLNSIHLKGGAYARADAYQLSKGDALGFGGSLATCRVRAFNLTEAYPGLALGEYDVLNLYRRWLKKRQPSFTKKLINRPQSATTPQNNAPLDNMSPHTMIVNYGLDGAIDPPPAGARFPDLHRWLEVHPLVDSDWGKPNTTTSVLDLLTAMKKRVGTGPDVKVEAQLFGFEPGGLFSFIGSFPPSSQPRTYQFATNMISGDPGKFKRAMDTLAAAGIVPLISTSPFSLQFNRGRFRGHFVRRTVNESWSPAIPYQFPAAYKTKSCAVTNVTIKLSSKDAGKKHDRLWVVEPFRNRIVEPAAACDDVARIRAAQRMDENGKLVEQGAVLGTGFYKLYKKGLCPTEDMKKLYVQDWLRNGLFANGVRLLEFMLHFKPYLCYNRAHQHIEPRPQYDNVIGHGAWYVARAKKVLEEVQQAGQSRDSRNPFTLTNEDVPIEQFIPYFDDYYYSNPLFNYLYSALVTPKMSLHRDFMIHPGYKEARQNPAQPPGIVLPKVMVEANLETEKPDPTRPGVMINRLPPPHTTAKQLEEMVTALLASLPPETTEEQRKIAKEALVKRVTDANSARALSFNLWLKACREYFETYFKVVDYGIAPRGYPVGPEDSRPKLAWNPARPLNPSNNPPTYTYVRCVQDVFNLWANIFETGTSAVFGERILIPSVWFETPTDYNEPAIGMAVRAAQFQMNFKDYFKRGQILGDALITSVDDVPFGKKSLWCWGTAALNDQRRTFYDVVNNQSRRLLVDGVLPDDIAADDAYFGGEGEGVRWRESKDLTDLISRSVDKPVYKFTNGKGEQVEVAPDYRTYLKVPHLVWQSGEGDARKVLYAFCNIGNTPAKVAFSYGRGLEGVSDAAQWRKTVMTFSEPATPPQTGDVHLGSPEQLTIPPLSLVGIEIKKP